jgi:1-acyl-sn-glycerol-3-phosphate acyltransferase
MRERPIRRAANAVFTFGWTMGQSAMALGDHAVRGDAASLRRYPRRWADGLLRAWGIRLAVEGLERVPTGQRLVIVCNHQSYIDVVALFHVLPELPVFLAKQELSRVPLFGRVMGELGHVFVDRGKHEQAIASIEAAARTLQPGMPVVVFPEGTRTRRPVIQPFKKGAFHLAKAAHAPILPIGIVGSHEAWPRGTAAPVPAEVKLRIGMPIPASEVDALPLDDLIDRARAEIVALTGLPPVDRSETRRAR